MNSLKEVTEKYPDVFVNTDGGPDTFQEGVKIIERDPVAVIIKHPHEDLYLLADWKSCEWKGFLTGGIEEGDSLEETVKKEVREETGFTDITNIKPLDFVTHALFFHTVKGVNRLAHYHLVYSELKSLAQEEVSEEEKAIADFIWVPFDKVLETITREEIKKLWNFFVENKGVVCC